MISFWSRSSCSQSLIYRHHGDSNRHSPRGSTILRPCTSFLCRFSCCRVSNPVHCTACRTVGFVLRDQYHTLGSRSVYTLGRTSLDLSTSDPPLLTLPLTAYSPCISRGLHQLCWTCCLQNFTRYLRGLCCSHTGSHYRSLVQERRAGKTCELVLRLQQLDTDLWRTCRLWGIFCTLRLCQLENLLHCNWSFDDDRWLTCLHLSAGLTGEIQTLFRCREGCGPSTCQGKPEVWPEGVEKGTG